MGVVSVKISSHHQLLHFVVGIIVLFGGLFLLRHDIFILLSCKDLEQRTHISLYSQSIENSQKPTKNGVLFCLS